MCIHEKEKMEFEFHVRGKFRRLLVSKKMCGNGPSELRDFRTEENGKGAKIIKNAGSQILRQQKLEIRGLINRDVHPKEKHL